jgi:dTDP-glucose pyrophosphorylase
VNYINIKTKINEINRCNYNYKWQSKNLNIVIPMAGEGRRFYEKYSFPKPLIDIHGKPMIQLVVENLNIEANYIFIVRKEHYEKYNLKYLLNLIAKNCEIIIVDQTTRGAAETVLLAKSKINSDESLFIVNSDQFIEWNNEDFYYSSMTDNSDGCILTFKSSHPKWSFCTVDDMEIVTSVTEKIPVSDIANVGMYFWKKGSDYVKYAEQMIDKNIRTNEEFYVAPVYNQAIEDKKIIKHVPVEKMWGLGTPEDLEYFLNNYENL